MTFRRVLAQSTVTDLAAAERWYATAFRVLMLTDPDGNRVVATGE